jgi:3'(2'),5'-bisphosphate nucleotidase
MTISNMPWALAQIASEAGAIVARHYAGGCAAQEKADGSPVTIADLEAEAHILAALKRLSPDTAIIAEEQMACDGCATPKGAFFLVDPLDGTREFVARNGEFTVNIALIDQGSPIAGCVYAPALRQCFVGAPGIGAWRATLAPGEVPAAHDFAPIRARPCTPNALVAAISRSHHDAETAAFLTNIPVVARRIVGSSLKFCLLAAGEADVYPRFGSVMEWDVAAGHAVLDGAGGVIRTPEGAPLQYGRNDKSYRMGPFIAWGDPALGQAGV